IYRWRNGDWRILHELGTQGYRGTPFTEKPLTENYRSLGNIVTFNNLFFPKAAEALDKMDVLYIKEDAQVKDNPPIQLKNNWFVRQFELLTDMYGRPDYNEFDPTPYISVFFLLFFAMCMGDAGYGLALIIGGILLRNTGMKDMAPLVTILGVGTFVVGIVMHTFFGVDISVLPWIPSWLKAVMITGTIGGFEAQMVLSLVIGIVHLCLAMVVKTVYATKNKGFLGSLGIWGWTLLIVGGVAMGSLAMFLSIPAEVTKWLVIGLGVISALGIFLFNDIHRNPLKNIGSGLWETYNTVTGLLGDILSYLRLYALGLAGGMLGKAFNDIATMTLGDGGFGIVPFAIILIIGHTLNLAMCCLGAFVHPLRLNFLEFFKNSGYDGKGRSYRPIKK
ncbi:MAG: ATPase V, partial [Bacteroidales bacterium]|nr:ATPase V [Bacteroidales bacterium]